MATASYVAIARGWEAPHAFGRPGAEGLLHLRSHLVVVGHLLLPATFIYARPSRMEAMDLNKVLSVILHCGHAHVQPGHLLPAEQGGPGSFP